MKQVTREQFFAVVVPVDSVISINGNAAEYKMRYSDKLIGKSVESLSDDPNEYTRTEYFLTDSPVS